LKFQSNFFATIDFKQLSIVISPSKNMVYGVGEKFWRFKKLKHLRISGINYIEMRHFESLSRLTKLELSSNPIKYIPSDCFEELTKLEFLVIEGTDLVHIPDNLFVNLRKLKWLEISNTLIDRLDENLLINNKNLESVAIRNNKNLEQIEIEFTKLPKISAIDLDKNYCTYSSFHKDQNILSTVSSIQQLQQTIRKGCSKGH
jgi:Leucine-rich repeat (LRR) protein